MVVVLIEDIVAVNNLQEILAVDDIDCFMVVPGDLSQSMGYLGQATHPNNNRKGYTADRCRGEGHWLNSQ